MQKILFLVFITFLAFWSKPNFGQETKELSGDLIIFHAGSLSVPLHDISKAFEKENPKVHVLLEAAGSVACARKITDLNKPCDIMLSADYAVIDKMLIPNYADWNVKFASNEMAIVFTEKSRRNQEINQDNWFEIILDPNIEIGRADPNSDPCGYRTVLVSKLAEKYYQRPELAAKLLEKNKNNIRPKETDLLALLESNSLDYIFLYRSVAVQHQLKFITLPDEINLRNPEFSTIYKTVSVDINGKKPGEKMTQMGEPMVYGVCILKDAPNAQVAEEFVKFLLSTDKGVSILEKLGQPSVIPASTNTYLKLPEALKKFAKE